MKILWDRFWMNIEVDEKTGCWNWIPSIIGGGPRVFSIENGKRASPKKVAWMLEYGGNLPDRDLHSSCKNVLCVRPSHHFMFANDGDRFWSHVDICGEDECWEWTGSRNRSGYGHMRIGKDLVFAHRISYQVVNGVIPAGMKVLHKCDNPPCVNPAHLFLGTSQDNAIDREMKGRGVHYIGESHGRAKLTESDVIKIRRLYSSGDHTQYQLAMEFNISRSVIKQVVQNRIWKHVKEESYEDRYFV